MFHCVPPRSFRYSRLSPSSCTTSFAPGANPSPPLRAGVVKPEQSAYGVVSPASDPEVCVPWPLVPVIVDGQVSSSPTGPPDQL